MLLFARDLRKHRQRQYHLLIAMRIGKLFRARVQPAIGFQKWQRCWIVDCRLHAARVQMSSQRIASRMFDGVQMIDVGAVRAQRRYDKVFDLVEAGIVDRCRFLTRPRP